MNVPKSDPFASRRLEISIVNGSIAGLKRTMTAHLFQTRAESTLKC